MIQPLPPELEAQLRLVSERMGQAERQHRQHRNHWNQLYRLFRSVSSWRNAVSSASPRDRDSVLGDGRREFGEELFIPYAYRQVEEIVPRMLANRPRPLILPDDRTAEPNVRAMKVLMDKQLSQVDIEMKLQDTCKSGLTYGLGVGKSMWRHDYLLRNDLVPSVKGDGSYAQTGPQLRCVFDDPDYEDIDIFDFFWRPLAYDTRTLGWAIHRTWRDKRYVLDKLAQGQWGNVTAEDVEALGPGEAKYDEAWADRLKAAGMTNLTVRGEQVHEVWEYHDGEQVIVVLDRQVPVAQGPNPAWHGELPFHVFRPQTAGIKQLPGIGEIEPIRDLQLEMNTLRSQRRDNATLVLQRVFAYADGFIDPADFKFGPGIAIPVNGDPRELLFPLPLQDIPNSGYQEEDRIQQDIERTSGLSDPSDVASGQTATGQQIVAAATSARVSNKTLRFQVEVVKSFGRQWLLMNQRKILENRDIRVPAEPVPGEADRRWAWIQVGPDELAGEMIFDLDGTTMPDNIPQKRQDATLLQQVALNNPMLDQRLVLIRILGLMGVENPEAWLVPEQQQLPAQLPDALVRLGVPQELVQTALKVSAGAQNGNGQ